MSTVYRSRIEDIAKHQEQNLRAAIGDAGFEALARLTEAGVSRAEAGRRLKETFKSKEEKMKKIRVTKRFEFEAAHWLPNHPGQCKYLHGHRYELEVTIEGKTSDIELDTGMLVDFGYLKKTVKQFIIDRFDHRSLNTVFKIPTAENVANYIFKELTRIMGSDVALGHLGLYSIKLWETSNSYAEVVRG